MGQQPTKTFLSNENDMEAPKTTYNIMEKEFSLAVSFKNKIYLGAMEDEEIGVFYLFDEKNFTIKLVKEFQDLILTGAFEHEGRLMIYFSKNEDFSNSFWFTMFDGENFTEIEEKKVINDEESQSQFLPIFDSETGEKYILHNFFVSSSLNF
jgi:hypothetical protein